MRIGSRTLVACALGLSALLAVACDEPMVANDASTDPMMDGGGGGGDDAGGGGGDDDGGTGMPGDDCASRAAAYCARFEECSPAFFRGTYENQDICRRVWADGCSTGAPIPLTNGLTDEAACEAGQVASCDAFLAAMSAPTPSACVPRPGDVTTIQGDCFNSAQCGETELPSGDTRQMYCRPLNSGGVPVWGTAECPRGECIPAIRLGGMCNPANQGTTEFCDIYAGQACAQQFEDSGSGVTGSFQCRQIQYGTNGDECAPNSDRQCASGLRCYAPTRRCMAVRDEGSECSIGANDLCDNRRGLSCQDLGDGPVCAGPKYVAVGAQCGDVTDPETGRTTQRLCSAYASCETVGDTTRCVARAALGETCTQVPDNCWPGLECDDDTDVCVVPEPGEVSCD